VILVNHCAVHDHEWQEEADNYSNSSFRKPYLLIESDWPEISDVGYLMVDGRRPYLLLDHPTNYSNLINSSDSAHSGI
jgi:hypothetical protein